MEGLAEQRLQFAKADFQYEKGLAKNIFTQLKDAENERLESIAMEIHNNKLKVAVDFAKYKEKKRKIECIHKATNLSWLLMLPHIVTLMQRQEADNGDGDKAESVVSEGSPPHGGQKKYELEQGRTLLSEERLLNVKKWAPVKGILEQGAGNLVSDATETSAPVWKSEEVEVKIHQLCSLNGQLILKVDIIPIEYANTSDLKQRQENVFDPVESGGEEISRIDVHAIENFKPKIENIRESVKVNLQAFGGQAPVKLQILYKDGVFSKVFHLDLFQPRSASPNTEASAKVHLQEGPGFVKVEVLTEDGQIKTAQALRHKLHDKEECVPREDNITRKIRYMKEDWVPREVEEDSMIKDPLFWECKMDLSRTSSSKVIWSPNEKYLEGRNMTKLPLQTASMKLFKRLRPKVDRPQFNVSPEVINFKRLRFGTTRMKVLTISNYQSDLSRFKVFTCEKSIRVVYDHGALAAGMDKSLKIYLEGCIHGSFLGKVHIETEFDIYIIPVIAEIVQIL
ncbi:hypothetical protein SELMODRAFT_432605 [Selaginella moellendorffii]|uniref:Uncharacterized protein n=1 Tax=Selaginella moellendorffii TaxID=88036 RepID=D8TGI4_SELML|nr:hypothetical protein SELMODRAFT_432605 [Selaginella moellendorffii]